MTNSILIRLVPATSEAGIPNRPAPLRFLDRGPTGPKGDQGDQGFPSETGLLFAWSGVLNTVESPIPGVMSTPGVFSAVSSALSYEVAATNVSAFLIYMRPTTGGSLALFATATFSSTGASIVLAGDGTYPAGAYFKCVPPVSTDPTLFGPTILLAGP